MTLSKNQQLYQNIVDLHSTHNKTQSEISEQLGITTRTVRNYLSMFRRSVPIDVVKDTGRPTKLSGTVRNRMIAELEKDPFSTSKDITRAVNVEENGGVSDRTIRSYLKTLDYKSSLPRNVPFITNVQKVKRVEWAESHRDFDWSSVFFLMKRPSNFLLTSHAHGTKSKVVQVFQDQNSH